MATKKPKTTSKKAATTKSKAASSKPKTTAAKTAVKPVTEAPKNNKTEVKTEVKVEEKVENKKLFAGFFAKKYEGTESILTIFKCPKFYGALAGEIFGTMAIALLLLSLSLMGLANIAMYAFAVIAILVAIYAFSGANLNPLVTVGMMATRRMSVIRGVMYIIAQVVGAWIGWLIFNAFYLAGGDGAYTFPAMAAVADGNFWVVTLIELFGAIMIAFFYNRALVYKRSVFTFAAVATGGLCLAVLVGYVVSAAFLSLQNNFVFNPAVALMYQIFPTAGESFGEVFGGICSALAIYVLFPMVGGVIGFYLSDFISKLSDEETKA